LRVEGWGVGEVYLKLEQIEHLAAKRVINEHSAEGQGLEARGLGLRLRVRGGKAEG
jgi:hypothetical protein